MRAQNVAQHGYVVVKAAATDQEIDIAKRLFWDMMELVSCPQVCADLPSDLQVPLMFFGDDFVSGWH